MDDMPKVIPRVIHYCWFGRGEKPDLVVRCIKSWKQLLFDYEIIEWNEDNFDIDSNLYVREAYMAKKYAFVSDYARFLILYKFGGLYMDTDVEVIKPLDEILTNGAFMGFENNTYVSPGLIMGAHKHNVIIKACMESYHNRRFILDDGSYDLTVIALHTVKILQAHGLETNGLFQRLDYITIYPKTFFCPLNWNNHKTDFSKDTCTIHHFAGSWATENQRKRKRNVVWNFFYRVRSGLIFILKRIFGDERYQKCKRLFQ